MAGARSLWRATGMKDDDFSKPIIAIANSSPSSCPAMHLKDLGQLVAREIEAGRRRRQGVQHHRRWTTASPWATTACFIFAAQPRHHRRLVEYMVNAHCADALVCISNCDKITPGMLMAAMRLNIPVVFVSGGPMEAGKVRCRARHRRDQEADLIDAMVDGRRRQAVSDADVGRSRASACPTCGSARACSPPTR